MADREKNCFDFLEIMGLTDLIFNSIHFFYFLIHRFFRFLIHLLLFLIHRFFRFLIHHFFRFY